MWAVLGNRVDGGGDRLPHLERDRFGRARATEETAPVIDITVRRGIAITLLALTTMACVGTKDPEETGKGAENPHDAQVVDQPPTPPVYLQPGYEAGRERGVREGSKARDRELRAEAHAVEARVCRLTLTHMIAAVNAWDLHALSITRTQWHDLDCSLVGHGLPVAFSQRAFG
jgi:hypothetical protein